MSFRCDAVSPSSGGWIEYPRTVQLAAEISASNGSRLSGCTPNRFVDDCNLTMTFPRQCADASAITWCGLPTVSIVSGGRFFGGAVRDGVRTIAVTLFGMSRASKTVPTATSFDNCPARGMRFHRRKPYPLPFTTGTRPGIERATPCTWACQRASLTARRIVTPQTVVGNQFPSWLVGNWALAWGHGQDLRFSQSCQ